MIYSPFSDEMLTAMSKESISFVLAGEIFFDSGTTRVHTGTGDLVLSGYVFTGAGNIGKCGIVTEENSTSPSQMALTLSGLDFSLLTEVLNENCVGRTVRCHLVALDETGTAIVSDLLYKGFISATAALAGKTSGLNLTVSNVFEKWAEGSADRYTDESQKSLRDGDRFFRYVAQMAERSLYWGAKKDAPSFLYV